MAHEQKEVSPFTGFGIGTIPRAQPEEGVFILVVYRDGSLAAAAHTTERGAMEAATEYLEDERDEDDERRTLEDWYVRAQRVIADEGGVMEIIHSPIIGSD